MSLHGFSKKVLCSAFFFLAVYAFPSAQETDTSIITISSAQKTEYAKDENSDEELITFTGNVSLSVKTKSTEVKIEASSVTFNRATDMLSAKGGVSLVQTEGGTAGGQKIFAESLLFNTRTMEGVFDEARVFQTQGTGLNLPTGSTLVVNAEIFGRDSSSTVVFKNGELTFCEDENPHWKIKASRIWLLPGQEFAFFNAVLSLGNVPVLYLPAFYYPKDELVFHPVFGYTSRMGYYFQTTTYLYGRKPLSKSSSSSSSSSSSNSSTSATDVMDGIFNFMKPTSLKKQEREGLVLHNLDEDYTGSTSDYVKLIADYYTTAGGLLGVDASFAPKTEKISISRISASLMLGFSTTVFSTGSGYSQYAPSGKVYYNTSSFMGLNLPFRYSAGLSAEISSPFTLKVSLPLYSDPFFNDDFASRDEDMDWFSFLMSRTSNSTGTSTSSGSEINSFEWNVNASYSVKLPELLKPYISTLSFTGSSLVRFASRTNKSVGSEDLLSSYSPQRKFFYPSQVTPLQFSAKVSGTIFEYPASSQMKSQSVSYAVPLDIPEELKPPAQDNETKKETDSSSEETVFTMPELTLEKNIASINQASFSGLSYKLTYSLSPALVTQMQYDGEKLSSPEDFDWSQIQSSYIQMKSPLELSSLFTYRSSFVSVKNTLSFTPVYQDHPSTEGLSQNQANNLKSSDYAARKLELSESNTVSFRPFLYSSVFAKSGIDWNTSFKLLRTQYNGTVSDPSWDFIGLDITDSASFTAHTVSATFRADETESFSQSLVLTTTLPPQTDLYKATLSLTFPYVTASLSAGIQKKSASSDEWKLQPLQQNASLSLFKQTSLPLTLSESFNYNLEEGHGESFRLSLSWNNIVASYTMQHTYGYDFDSSLGWVTRGEKEFLPVNFSLSYSLKTQVFRFWKNRITLTPSLSTSIVLDFIRPTSSYFTFSPTLSFSINNFLEISFSAQSRNDVIYRYVQNLFPSGISIPGETNPFVDLFNSFAFWGDGQFYDSNQTARKSSGFKLKSLSVKVSHDLHDWKLSAELSVSPRLVTSGGQKQYSFDPYFTLSVVWKPLPSIKTQVTDKYGTWEFE